MSDDLKFLNRRQASDWFRALGISISHDLLAMRAASKPAKGPVFHKVGGTPYYRPEDLRAYLDASRRVTAA